LIGILRDSAGQYAHFLKYSMHILLVLPFSEKNDMYRRVNRHATDKIIIYHKKKRKNIGYRYKNTKTSDIDIKIQKHRISIQKYKNIGYRYKNTKTSDISIQKYKNIRYQYKNQIE
jgi:hypothetical protein